MDTNQLTLDYIRKRNANRLRCKKRHNKYRGKDNQKAKEYYYLHKEQMKTSQKKWLINNKEQYKETYNKWLKTQNGHKYNSRRCNKRNRNKDFIELLPNIFPDDIPVDWHHVDGKMFVISLPSRLHTKVSGRFTTEHIKHANDWIEFYYNINPIKMITG